MLSEQFEVNGGSGFSFHAGCSANVQLRSQCNDCKVSPSGTCTGFKTYTSFHILFYLVLVLPHFKTGQLQTILIFFPISTIHSHFLSPPLLPHPSTRSWRSASAITTMPSYSPSERLTVTASRHSSSSQNRSSKHSALNWRTRAKPCWVSSHSAVALFAACCTIC